MMRAMGIAAQVVPLFFAAAGSANADPSGAPIPLGAGVGAGSGIVVNTGYLRVDEWMLVIRATASGAITLAGNLWVINTNLFAPGTTTPDLNVWSPAGKGATMGARGAINDGNNLTGTDTLVHRELWTGIGAIDGAYLRLTTATGSGLQVAAWLVGQATRS